MESGQVSGKVFRFLSAMHPALSKQERKRFKDYEPDSWYDWTPEVAAEFSDLVSRSPRDESFGRGLAYVAQNALPEGGYVPLDDFFEHLGDLPSAFRSGSGNGFEAAVEADGHATVVYRGMPGFKNVCIAVVGELQQRLQAAGARGVDVRHASPCRLRGGDECRLEITWSGVAPPSEGQPVDLATILGVPFASEGGAEAVVDAQEQVADRGPQTFGEAEEAEEAVVVEETTAVEQAASPQLPVPEPPAAPPTPQPRPTPAVPAQAEAATGPSSDDLFVQLKERLTRAEEGAQTQALLQSRLETLTAELEDERSSAAERVAAAQEEAASQVKTAQEKTQAVETELAELKSKILELVRDD